VPTEYFKRGLCAIPCSKLNSSIFKVVLRPIPKILFFFEIIFWTAFAAARNQMGKRKAADQSKPKYPRKSDNLHHHHQRRSHLFFNVEIFLEVDFLRSAFLLKFEKKKSLFELLR